MSGDCGGTNTRLRVFHVPPDAHTKLAHGQKPPGVVVFDKTYVNEEHKSIEDICKLFLKEAAPFSGSMVPTSCCLACAGAITDNSVVFTNVADGWTIRGESLSKSLGIPKVVLVNDFVAQGYGLLTLEDSEKMLLNDAKPVPGAPIACVGAGTGLGECYLTASPDGKYTCWPSEGGHTEFSPRSKLTEDLFDFLKDRFAAKKRVSVERVVSGTGLANIYEFLREHWAFEGRMNVEIDKSFNAAEPSKKGMVIAEGAKEGDPVCSEAVNIFNECFGAEAGAAALKWLPKGGLYISGGIAAKNPAWIKSEQFVHAYEDKGRLADQVKSTPLYLVLAGDVGERGAQYVAVSLMGQVVEEKKK